MQKPRTQLWAVLRKIAGVLLIIIGLIALFTPLTPGSWLAIIGLQLLGLEFLWHDYLKPPLQRLKNT